MSSRQWESGIVVIKGRLAPGSGLMTRTTICPKLTIVRVPGSMAGVTILRRAFIDSVPMAGSTWHTCMTAVQRESGVAMIEGYIAPAAGSMTGCTVLTELTVMPVIVCVTGIAVLRRTLEDAIDMTTGTLNTGMTAPQGECCIVVFKGDIPPTGGRMACGAVRAELTCMPIVRGMTGEAIL